jgi:hypothetical protein
LRVLISALEYIGTDGDSKDKKGCGCMIVIISVNYRWLALLWYDLYQSRTIKGIINNKLPNNKVLERLLSEDVYVITNELYLNKKCGDSITIIND